MSNDTELYIIKNNKNGLYYVEGYGFSATAEDADQYDYDTADQIADQASSFGIEDVDIEEVTADEVVAEVTGDGQGIKQNADGTSFAVSFVRPNDLNSDGSIKSHKLNPSKRRFATKAEAQHHGARFTVSQGHLGYYVTLTHDPVNSWVNQGTGLTNPEVGKKRVGGVNA